MSTYEELLRLARALPEEQRERLAAELLQGIHGVHNLPGRGAPRLPMAGPAPHSVAWLKAERGHAVLATDTGPAEADIPPGAAAIAGMWADLRSEQP
jgi:hypothetical protein